MTLVVTPGTVTGLVGCSVFSLVLMIVVGVAFDVMGVVTSKSKNVINKELDNIIIFILVYEVVCVRT